MTDSLRPTANGSGKAIAAAITLIMMLGAWVLRGLVDGGLVDENLRTRVNRNERDIQAIQRDVRETRDDAQYLRAQWEDLGPQLQRALRREPPR